MISVTGIHFYREVKMSGWQMAIALMRHRIHPSHIWEWPESLRMGEYTAAKRALEHQNNGSIIQR